MPSMLPLGAAFLGGALMTASLVPTEPQDSMEDPGPEHALLERFEGKFQSRIEIVGGPNGKPFVVQGANEAELILGGRFVLSRGMEGEGEDAKETLTLLGYDRKMKRYTFLSLNSQDTAMTWMSGTADDEGTISLETFGKEIGVTMEWIDEDHYLTGVTLPAGSSLKIAEALSERQPDEAEGEDQDEDSEER